MPIHRYNEEMEKINAVKRLLECPDLNLDELEDETREAIEEVRRVFRLDNDDYLLDHLYIRT